MESASQFRGSARRSVLVDLGDARTDWATATDASGIRVSARGHAWIDEAYKEEESLAEAVRDRLSGCEPDETADRIQDLVPRLNGGWGLVVERSDGWVAAATDRMRTIPLFWHLSGDQLVIAHDARVCARKAGGRPADVKSTVEFVLAGFITGRETLFEGVQQVQPGEVCIFGPGEQPSRARYFRHHPWEKAREASEEDLMRELEVVLDEVFSSLANSLNGRQLVVPLSGGADSRLVAAMLHRHGLRDVLCFAYGKSGSGEVEISRSVAETLGFGWIHADEGDRWAGCFQDRHFQDVWSYGGKGCSLALAPDIPSMEVLTAGGHIDRTRAVVFPGHTGDMLSGAFIPADFRRRLRRPDTVAAYVMRHHYDGLPSDLCRLEPEARRHIADKIESVATPPAGQEADFVTRLELWNAESRQARFIINSVRGYEYHGLGWRTLWDNRIMDFFLRVPHDLRFGQRLYVRTLAERIFNGSRSRLADIPLSEGRSFHARQGFKGEASLGQRFRTDALEAVRPMLRAARNTLGGRIPGLDAVGGAPNRGHMEMLGAVGTATTLGDALGRTDGLGDLPEEAAQALAPALDRRLTDIPWTAIVRTLMVGAQLSNRSEP